MWDGKIIRAIFCGTSGRMGHEVLKQSILYGDFWIAGAIEKTGHPDIGRGLMCNREVTDDLEKCIKKEDVDVIIDFTEPEASVKYASTAATYGKPLVIGTTTDFSEKQKIIIKACAESIPIVLSPNFSIGVNILFKVLADVAKITGDDYDVEIVEAHHNQKKDASSGTAIKMAEVIAGALNYDSTRFICQRNGPQTQRTKKEIGIQAIRGGDIFGEHTVMFCGQGEGWNLSTALVVWKILPGAPFARPNGLWTNLLAFTICRMSLAYAKRVPAFISTITEGKQRCLPSFFIFDK